MNEVTFPELLDFPDRSLRQKWWAEKKPLLGDKKVDKVRDSLDRKIQVQEETQIDKEKVFNSAKNYDDAYQIAAQFIVATRRKELLQLVLNELNKTAVGPDEMKALKKKARIVHAMGKAPERALMYEEFASVDPKTIYESYYNTYKELYEKLLLWAVDHDHKNEDKLRKKLDALEKINNDTTIDAEKKTEEVKELMEGKRRGLPVVARVLLGTGVLAAAIYGSIAFLESDANPKNKDKNGSEEDKKSDTSEWFGPTQAPTKPIEWEILDPDQPFNPPATAEAGFQPTTPEPSQPTTTPDEDSDETAVPTTTPMPSSTPTTSGAGGEGVSSGEGTPPPTTVPTEEFVPQPTATWTENQPLPRAFENGYYVEGRVFQVWKGDEEIVNSLNLSGFVETLTYFDGRLYMTTLAGEQRTLEIGVADNTVLLVRTEDGTVYQLTKHDDAGKLKALEEIFGRPQQSN